MNQWAFVIAAYAIVGLVTVSLILWAWQSMRASEADAEAAKRRQ
jgi:uncharacterized membrane protein YuzA (DUF378 family)